MGTDFHFADASSQKEIDVRQIGETGLIVAFPNEKSFVTLWLCVKYKKRRTHPLRPPRALRFYQLP